MKRMTLIGATGGTGEAFLGMALEAGYEVTCIARTPSKIPMTHERLEVIKGDVRDVESLKPGLVGRDIVVGIFGVASFSGGMKATDLYSVGTTNLLKAMGEAEMSRKRLVMVSSSAVVYDGKAPFMWNRVFRPLMWRMYADMSQMELLVAASGFDWTIVRPPQLVDGPLTGKLIVSADTLPEGKHKITRADLAAFLLEEVKSEQYLHQWPMLAS